MSRHLLGRLCLLAAAVAASPPRASVLLAMRLP